jgi:hypothetical protein
MIHADDLGEYDFAVVMSSTTAARLERDTCCYDFRSSTLRVLAMQIS